jgi:hypothetical protein
MLKLVVEGNSYLLNDSLEIEVLEGIIADILKFYPPDCDFQMEPVTMEDVSPRSLKEVISACSRTKTYIY